jgi:hypothetical protein
MKTYQDNQTGVWNGLSELKYRKETISDVLSDCDGENYDATIEFEVCEDTNAIIDFKIIKGDGRLEFDDVVYMAGSLNGSFDCDIEKTLSKSF